VLHLSHPLCRPPRCARLQHPAKPQRKNSSAKADPRWYCGPRTCA